MFNDSFYSNTQVLGPLEGKDIFVEQDFELLQNFENNRCGYKVAEIVSVNVHSQKFMHIVFKK